MRIEIGDKVKIPADGKFHPEAGHFGICVWISEDRKTVAVRCNRSHHGKKNAVFLVKINSKK
ncbi:MAG: hypothetical protein OEY24_06155 [Candidatus Bathyarchaeota archaeon]|nr:hypothetical protein [Candidatus Bathyarchaeota archaeon]MDH5495270.1 hypothetical protein [Candidatus Bathyarchaeota archaeon]